MLRGARQHGVAQPDQHKQHKGIRDRRGPEHVQWQPDRRQRLRRDHCQGRRKHDRPGEQDPRQPELRRSGLPWPTARGSRRTRSTAPPGRDRSGRGANNNQTSPVVTSAAGSGSNIEVQGTLTSAASTTFRLEFFRSPTCNSSGSGEGAAFLGSSTEVTDGGGNLSFDLAVPASGSGSGRHGHRDRSGGQHLGVLAVRDALPVAVTVDGSAVQTGPRRRQPERPRHRGLGDLGQRQRRHEHVARARFAQARRQRDQLADEHRSQPVGRPARARAVPGSRTVLLRLGERHRTDERGARDRRPPARRRDAAPQHPQPRLRVRRPRGHADPDASRLRRHESGRRHAHRDPVRRIGGAIRRCAAPGHRPAVGGLHDHATPPPRRTRRCTSTGSRRADNCSIDLHCDNAAIYAVALRRRRRTSSTRPTTTTTAPATRPTARCARRSTPPTPRPRRAWPGSRSPSRAAARSRSRCSARRCRRSPCRSRSTGRPSPASRRDDGGDAERRRRRRMQTAWCSRRARTARRSAASRSATSTRAVRPASASSRTATRSSATTSARPTTGPAPQLNWKASSSRATTTRSAARTPATATSSRATATPASRRQARRRARRERRRRQLHRSQCNRPDALCKRRHRRRGSMSASTKSSAARRLPTAT